MKVKRIGKPTGHRGRWAIEPCPRAEDSDRSWFRQHNLPTGDWIGFGTWAPMCDTCGRRVRWIASTKNGTGRYTYELWCPGCETRDEIRSTYRFMVIGTDQQIGAAFEGRNDEHILLEFHAQQLVAALSEGAARRHSSKGAAMVPRIILRSIDCADDMPAGVTVDTAAIRMLADGSCEYGPYRRFAGSLPRPAMVAQETSGELVALLVALWAQDAGPAHLLQWFVDGSGTAPSLETAALWNEPDELPLTFDAWLAEYHSRQADLMPELVAFVVGPDDAGRELDSNLPDWGVSLRLVVDEPESRAQAC